MPQGQQSDDVSAKMGDGSGLDKPESKPNQRSVGRRGSCRALAARTRPREMRPPTLPGTNDDRRDVIRFPGLSFVSCRSHGNRVRLNALSFSATGNRFGSGPGRESRDERDGSFFDFGNTG